MAYLERQAMAKGHPGHVLEGARSVVVVGMVYGRREAVEPSRTQAKIARYARGGDYHDLLWRRLEALLDWLKDECPDVKGRAVCDTAPLLERDFARLAGLGWIGKNTCLIDRRAGSFTVLGAMLVDVELAYDEPHASNHCGTCTRCLEACPTDAFDGPYQLNPSRCISYWTIEHKGPIPEPQAENLGDWAFGCDICQDVCPWNRKAPPGHEPALGARDEWVNPDLIEWLNRDPAAFTKSLKGTAMARSKRSRLLRNAALILGTRQVVEAVPALIDRLKDADPIIRGASAWALGRIGSDQARPALEAARDDPDPASREAIETALRRLNEAGPRAVAETPSARSS